MRRSLFLLPAIAVFAACSADTNVDPDHQTSGETVEVTPRYGFIDPPRCDDSGTVTIIEVNRDTDDERTVGTGPLSAGGEFSVVYETGEPGTYDVRAECPSTDAGGTLVLEDDYLVVEPVLVLTADPDELAPLEEFTVTGTWCVSQFEDSDPPVAQLSYLGEDLEPIVAGSAQPFGETLSVDLVAPEEPGTYDITGTCTYDYGCPEESPPIELGAGMGEVAAAGGQTCDPEVTEEYVLAQIVVAEPAPAPEPEPEPEPRTPAAPTGGAQPAQVQPTFTG